MTVKIIYITQDGAKKVAITVGPNTNTSALKAKNIAHERVVPISQKSNHEHN